jgi:hypothetical protein
VCGSQIEEADRSLMKKPIQSAILGAPALALTMTCAIALISVRIQASPKSHDRTTTMTGDVLAIATKYSLVELHGDFPQVEAFLFAPEYKRKHERQAPIVVHYLFWKNSEKKLSDSFFDYSALYTLQLHRDPACDETMRNLTHLAIQDESGTKFADMPMMEPAKGAPVTNPNTDLPLECYVLKPGNFRLRK